MHYSRPGLAAAAKLGSGPIRGVFCQAGVGYGHLFTVGGSSIFWGPTNVGSIPGQDLVRFAASPTQVIAISEGVAYGWQGPGTTFTAIANGVLPKVCDVAYLAGRFAFACTGSATWFYSELSDGTDETGLDFLNNNDSAAPNRAVAVLNDQLVFFTDSTVAFWSPSDTTDATDSVLPFSPNEGRGFQRGIAARDTLCFADNSLIWVGENGVVYRSSNTPGRISSSSIEDKIRQCLDWPSLSAFVATFEGHELYVLTIPGVGTYAYDLSRIGTIQGAYGDSYNRGLWSEWESWGCETFRGRVAATQDTAAAGFPGGSVVYVGDVVTNDLWQMQVGQWTDAGGPLVRRAFAFIKIEEGRPRMDGLVLHCVTGVGNAAPAG